MKNIFSIILLLLCTVLIFASCEKEDPKVSFSALIANGSESTTTTTLTLVFDKAIEGLSAENITLTAGETGATKGALTDRSNGTYELAISGITKAGDITVAVAKTGYTITPTSKTVSVNYYAASAAVGNFYYSDNTYSSTYDNTKSCIGIVCWTNPSDATQGKIISLDEVSKAWSTVKEETGATSETDGASNTDQVLAYSGYTAETYPAFAWCAEKRAAAPAGIKWYIPAKNELKDEVYANKAAINVSLKAAGKPELDLYWYWSSTETNRDDNAWDVTFGYGYASSYPKHYTSNVRVVSAF